MIPGLSLDVGTRNNNTKIMATDSLVSLDSNDNVLPPPIVPKSSKQKMLKTIFSGSQYQSKHEIRNEREIMFNTISHNQMVVLPGKKLRNVSLDMGMPHFKIIEVPIKTKPDEKNETEKKRKKFAQNV